MFSSCFLRPRSVCASFHEGRVRFHSRGQRSYVSAHPEPHYHEGTARHRQRYLKGEGDSGVATADYLCISFIISILLKLHRSACAWFFTLRTYKRQTTRSGAVVYLIIHACCHYAQSYDCTVLDNDTYTPVVVISPQFRCACGMRSCVASRACCDVGVCNNSGGEYTALGIQNIPLYYRFEGRSKHNVFSVTADFPQQPLLRVLNRQRSSNFSRSTGLSHLPQHPTVGDIFPFTDQF